MLDMVRRLGRGLAERLRDHEDRPAREGRLGDEDRGWRAASAPRDVRPEVREDTIAEADESWRNNPIGFRLTEMTGEMVLGRGMRLASVDPATQAFVDEWWHHPQNRMPERQYRLFRELYLTGELFVALFTNPFDGMTYLRTIPSRNIERIDTDPEDIERELRFHHVVGADGQARSWDADEMAHYALYRLEGATRGMAPIGPLLHWIRRYREWLMDRVRINKYKGAFLWDVTMLGMGADRQAVLARQQELAQPPRPGSVIVHAEDERWQAVSAHIDAPDAAADGKAIRRLIGLGAGFPLHYLAEADDSNRATAAEQELPVALHVQRLQASFGYFVADLAGRAAARSGRFADGKVGLIVPVFAEPNSADNLNVARAGKTAAEALVVAVERGWVSKDEAAGLFRRVFGELSDTVTSASGDGKRSG
jgi:hypothetical protein